MTLTSIRYLSKKRWQLIVVAVFTSAVAGCAVGPDFQRPDSPHADSYTRTPIGATTSASALGQEIQNFEWGGKLTDQWWRAFGSPSLNHLVDEALNHNPTAESAAATLRQAQELATAQRASLFPSIQANYSASRQKNPIGTISPTLTSGDPLYTLHTAQLAIGYSPDVFGGNRRLTESLTAQAELQSHQLRAARLTLAANVVTAAVQESSLREQVAALAQIVSLSNQSLSLIRKQGDLGYASGLDVAAQETAVAQAELSVPPMVKQLEQTRDLLALLEGRPPAQGDALTEKLDELRLPSTLPVSLPSTLVQNRPDVRAAEAQVHTASAQLGIAMANRLPQFSISGAYGGTANRFRDMFLDPNRFWGILGSITQPVFDFGNLLHLKMASEAALDAAKAQYRGVVLSAFTNVADSLYAIDADANLLVAAKKAETAATKYLALSKKQLELGFVSSLMLINAEQAFRQAQLTRIQAQAARLTDTAALYQALGGGIKAVND